MNHSFNNSIFHIFLGAFAEMRKQTISFITSAHVSFRPSVHNIEAISRNHCWSRKCVGPVSQSVYRLATGGPSGDRIPKGKDIPPVQIGPGAQPASCAMGIGSPGGKVRPGRDADHSPPSSAAVMEEQRYTYIQPLGHNRACNGNTLPLLHVLSMGF